MSFLGGVLSINDVYTLLFVVFSVLLGGYALGRITIKGISLGDAGVFIIALIAGALAFHVEPIPDTNKTQLLFDLSNSTYNFASGLKIVEALGLVLFVTSVGFIAGPKFFGNFKKNFKSYVVLALVVIVSGGLVAAGCILFGTKVLGVENVKEFTAMVVGLLAGALTSTPAFSASKEAVGAIYESAVATGYGVSYIFGVIGVVLFVQLMPKIVRANMDVEREKLLAASKESEKNEAKKATKLFELDGHGFAAFALAAIVGTFVGMIKIPLTSAGLSGTCFSLTTTGGCLLTSLVFGHFSHIGPVSIMPKESTLKIFKELGLILFLAGAGVAGGAKFVQLFQVSYLIYGMFMTIVPMIIG